jgi:hypothetical protein
VGGHADILSLANARAPILHLMSRETATLQAGVGAARHGRMGALQWLVAAGAAGRVDWSLVVYKHPHMLATCQWLHARGLVSRVAWEWPAMIDVHEAVGLGATMWRAARWAIEAGLMRADTPHQAYGGVWAGSPRRQICDVVLYKHSGLSNAEAAEAAVWCIQRGGAPHGMWSAAARGAGVLKAVKAAVAAAAAGQ